MIGKIWKLKGLIVRASCPLFFRKVGAGVSFTGRIRWPAPYQNVSIGNGCMIGHDVMFQTGKNGAISLGENSSVNTGCHLVACLKIHVGTNVAIGEYVSIRDQEHKFTPESGVREQGFQIKPVHIEDNVWIGRGAYIGPGSHIRSGSIVAANSVVRGSFPKNSLIAGAPGIVKRTIVDGQGENLTSTPGSRGVVAERRPEA